MRIFIKQWPLLIVLILCLTGCKKDNEPAFNSYLQFKIDGVQVECTPRAFYQPPVFPDKSITISGNWSGGSITLKLNESVELSAGQYDFVPFSSSTIRSGEIWAEGQSDNYYIAGSGGAFNLSVHGSGQVILTEINREYVKGTFEFVTIANPYTNIFKTVTNGEFHIKRG